MKPFKFLSNNTKGSLDVIEGQTYSTASLTDGQRFVQALYNHHNPVIEDGSESNRLLIDHIQRLEQMRNHCLITHEQYVRHREMLIEQENVRRRVNQTEDQIRLFNTTTVTTINPTFWTKIKMFGTGIKLVLKETWRTEPIGLVVCTFLSLIVCFIGIMKILGH